MRIDFCYHTHTYRCGHAFGSDEEMVLAAIKQGIKVLGFSDHVMLPLVNQDGIRGRYPQVKDYLVSINNLKEKYKDQIQIYIGFEAEYIPEFLNYYHYLLDNKMIDYLICGQHCYFNGKDLAWYGNGELLDKYVEDIILAMKSGLYKYIAHPDYFVTLNYEFDERYEKASEIICKTAAELDIPLELNLGQTRGCEIYKGYNCYPFDQFWKYAEKYHNKVIVGIDAHQPNDFADGDYKVVEKFVKEFNLNFIDRIDI